MDRFVLSIDQGTTGTTVLVFDRTGVVRGKAYAEFPQIYPQPGWVEHDAQRIWTDCRTLLNQALVDAQVAVGDVVAIGITNQRETIVCWDKTTGQPVRHALVWQDRRTAEICSQLKQQGLEPLFQQKTGLLLDPYFSGTKLKWILDQDSDLRRRAASGEVLAGTIDAWLIWNLSGGKVHVTDVTNASRTLLYNIREMDWDDELLRILNIPRAMLPRVVSSAEVVGHMQSTPGGGTSIPLSGIAGDQQAALFGQACFSPGQVKNTYGTGSFLLMHTGTTPPLSTQRLLTTIACRVGTEPVAYALEGAVFIAGAAVQWLRDGLGIIQSAHETESLATSLADNEGVYFVPALTGLGAPYWDPYARGLMVGLTRGTTKAHLARAALEAICYQTRDVVDAMARDAGIELTELRADGGAVANRFLMQFQADLLGVPVRIPAVSETTALGAAYLAGLGVGFWNSRNEIEAQWQAATTYTPTHSPARGGYHRWLEAVEKSKHWAAPQ